MGTRGSPLALRQTEIVQERLSALGIKTELCKVKTSGDIFLDKPLHQLNGFGVFVAEIDERMLCGDIDLAVHSMKDLPSKRPKELTISAILKRDSPYDVLLCRTDSARGLDGLREGATVGTSSMRRMAQLLRARPDLNILSLRGNLQTRLGKLKRGDYDAIVLAEAGLQRMGLNPDYVRLGKKRDSFPQPTRERSLVVARRGSEAEACSMSLDDARAQRETMIERRIMESVGGGCVVPLAVHADVKNGVARVLAEVLSRDGKRFVRLDEKISLKEDYMALATDMGERLMNMGGRELVDEAVKFFGDR